MAIDTIFQATILTNFIYPFLLLFFLLFAVLEKTKMLGEGKQTLNALISVIISLIFVAAVFPKVVVGNLVLFLAVGTVVIFVIMLLWGFVSGKDKVDVGKAGTVVAILIILGVILVILGSIGFGPVGEVANQIGKFMFKSGWSNSFWTNALFVIIVAAALAIVMKSQKK
jgi:hypothetical protein